VQASSGDRIQPLGFLKPGAPGVYTDAPCIKNVPIELSGGVVGEAVNISVRMLDADVCAAGDNHCPSVQPVGADDGRKGQLSWCPDDSMKAGGSHFPLRLMAATQGVDSNAEQSFFVRFASSQMESCTGTAPVVGHRPVVTVGAEGELLMVTEITDDQLLVAPPVVFYGIGTSTAIRAQESWHASDFGRIEGNIWQATIPIPLEYRGDPFELNYRIVVTDNDDERSARCDNTSLTEWFSEDVMPGHQAGTSRGQCEPCRSDDVCGGESSLCVLLEGQGYCMDACNHDDQCGTGAFCRVTESLNGRREHVCVPVSLDCGQVCLNDRFEGQHGNGQVENATELEVGTYSGLSVCDDDVDVYRVRVEPGEMLAATVLYDESSGYVDLRIEGSDGSVVTAGSARTNGGGRTIQMECSLDSQEALIYVWPYNGTESAYDLIIEKGAGMCQAPCTPDQYEELTGAGNAGSAAIELPFDETLSLCRGDYDRFTFGTIPNHAYSIKIMSEAGAAGLGYRLFRGDLLMEERDQVDDGLDFVGEDGVRYTLEIFPLDVTVQAEYRLRISAAMLGQCGEHDECPAGTRCVGGECVGGQCERDVACGDAELCVSPRHGQSLVNVGGECVAMCQSDRDCSSARQTRCKTLGPDRMACLVSGAQRGGERCSQHADCSGTAICLDEPNGYCAVLECDRMPCGPGMACATNAMGMAACRRVCVNDNECRQREGYSCTATGDEHLSVCIPD
jgi:hypothetical protein